MYRCRKLKGWIVLLRKFFMWLKVTAATAQKEASLSSKTWILLCLFADYCGTQTFWIIKTVYKNPEVEIFVYGAKEMRFIQEI